MTGFKASDGSIGEGAFRPLLRAGVLRRQRQLREPGEAPHDTVTITSNGDWCGGVPAGLAPVTCEALPQGDAWAFLCGDSAQQCAAMIAQEQAHLLGLQHADSADDSMFNPAYTSCRGFGDRENLVMGSRCRRVQNSFQLTTQRLGPADH
jgi:hypothetical protein